MDDKRIEIIGDEGEKISFLIVEQAKLAGANYLLVVENEDSEEAYILKEIKDENGELVYDFPTDEKELSAVSSYFDSILDDIDIE